MTPLIKLENVTLGYGRDIVLENISLEIPRGVFLPFVGPNGAGKTTLLRGILGLLKPFAGRIHTPFDRTPAGYVPQHKSMDPLFPLTVREIIQMGFYPHCGWWRTMNKEEKRSLEKILESLTLTPHAHKNYRDLSGGTKQKTLIARALLSGAEVFILDEPKSELDEETEKEVMEHLLGLVREGKTVLTVHHSTQYPAVRLASTICYVQHGKIRLQTMSPRTVSSNTVPEK